MLACSVTMRVIFSASPSWVSRYDRHTDDVQAPEVMMADNVDPEATVSCAAPLLKSRGE